MTPIEAYTGRQPRRFDHGIIAPSADGKRTPEEVRRLVRETLLKSAADRRKRQKGVCYKFHVGDQVLLKAHRVSDPLKKNYYKFKPLFQGPYKIERTFGPNAFELLDSRGERCGIHNASNIIPYYR